MALILHIDTSGREGLVVLAKNGVMVHQMVNAEPMQHASFLQPAIRQLMADAGFGLSALDAIAVSNGPGSYTGLRVGLASAKGLCFALDKPLITINSLLLMSAAAAPAGDFGGLLCPMIDARRMEVFFGLFGADLTPLIPTATAILDDQFLLSQLDSGQIIFAGDGAPKWKAICNHPNAVFREAPLNIASALCEEALKAFNLSSFANLAYAEPFYGKNFYTPVRQVP